jgi:hypothetical protein
MRTFSTVFFWTAILLLILWIGIPFIADISGLLLTDRRLSDFYHNTRYIVVPTAFLLTLFKTLAKGSAWHVAMRTIFLTVGAALFSVLVFASGFSDGLCGSTQKAHYLSIGKCHLLNFLKEFDVGGKCGSTRN